MAVANRKSSFLLLIIAVVVLCPLTRIDCHENIHKEVAVFVFGDSLFDPGNNNYINTIPVLQANYLPYGESYFSPPTGRFSDGRLISDFIAEYARLPLIPPYLEPGNNEFTYGANFASAGAGALIETLPGLGIYQIGGRKFGFLTVPLIGCFPALRIGQPGNTCNQEMNDIGSHDQSFLEEAMKAYKAVMPWFNSLFIVTSIY
ncbi:SGNH hydrolase-type esterase domain-containing protein [Tanacetum coccineum]